MTFALLLLGLLVLDPWIVYGKWLVPTTAAMLLIVFAFAWFAMKKAAAEWNELAKKREDSNEYRAVWMKLAKEREQSWEFRKAIADIIREEWKTDAFEEAVNTARKTLTDKLILETYNEIDRRISMHNARENTEAHRATIIHVIANYPPLADLVRRMEKQEARRR